MKSVVFVPIYNELRHLPQLLERLREAHQPVDTVLLVDNGSTDGSARLVRESGFEFISFERNAGVGGAYMAALDWALARDYDVFGAMAGNGKMLPDDLPVVFGPVLAGEADYVKGSRYLKRCVESHLPMFRRLAIPLVNAMVGLVIGRWLTDSTCGFRAFRLDIVRKAQFNWHNPSLKTYGLEYYLDAKVLLHRPWRFTEVPVVMRYVRGVRHTKIRAGRDWVAMLKPWWLARWDGQGFAA